MAREEAASDPPLVNLLRPVGVRDVDLGLALGPDPRDGGAALADDGSGVRGKHDCPDDHRLGVNVGRLRRRGILALGRLGLAAFFRCNGCQ